MVFFVFKQKTAYEMRISDWSSDVCSSDLRRKPVAAVAVDRIVHPGLEARVGLRTHVDICQVGVQANAARPGHAGGARRLEGDIRPVGIGRAGIDMRGCIGRSNGPDVERASAATGIARLARKSTRLN